MRSLRRSIILPAVVGAFVALVQAESKTDAQLDGLAGPVKSVSSGITSSGVRWEQPGGPGLVAPIWCRDCEYDPDGTKTKSGQMAEGKFFGEFVRLVRDADGHVTDRYSYSSFTGELQRHDVMGPFGKTEQKVYIGGKLRYRSTFSYDQYGHISDWLSFDGAGNSEGDVLFVTDKDGTILRRSVYGKNGELSYEQTFDPETTVEHFTTFDELGKMKLTWTVIHGKLSAFWESRDSPSQFGDEFTEPEGEGNVDKYSCHRDLSCDVSHVHYEYLDGDKHMPLSAEWRDSEGNLKLAAYFEYEVDSLRNWTCRRTWVWSPDLGERTLYETDFRAITYWK
jgi:hypothetical protein